VEISNPDKLYFPGVTKREVVQHYERVADVMLPFLVERPITLERFPDGVAAKGFMQKNASKHFPEFIGRVEVESANTTTIFPTISDRRGLVYLAGQGTIVFHIPGARIDDLGHPDRLVIDLDPADDDPGNVADVARITRTVLSDVGVAAGAMITGSSGIHVVVAIERTLDFARLARTARAIAGLVVATNSDLATTEFLKKDRHGKVFVDWLRNSPSATVVAPWSLRPRAEASVATPVEWGEVGRIDPAGVTIHDVAGRMDRRVTWPDPVDISDAADALIEAALDAGVDLDTPFDRFGRTRE
jgi:bifunctional non-homologous end joining protein LigD